MTLHSAHTLTCVCHNGCDRN